MSITTLPRVDHLVSAYEIGQMLGVSRQRVDQLTKSNDFPAPEVTLKVGRIWRTEDVRRWAAARGREVSQD